MKIYSLRITLEQILTVFLLVLVGLIQPNLQADPPSPVGSNMAGYFKVEVPRGKRQLVHVPFNSMDHQPRYAEELIGEQVPVGTQLHVFSPDEGSVADERSVDGWPDNIPFELGSSFWIHIPESAENERYTIYITGEIPETTVVTEAKSGPNLLGYSYPANMLWTNTVMATQAELGDRLPLWSVEKQLFETHTKTQTGWGDAKFLVIKVGEGFWLESKKAQLIEERNPYEFP